MSEIFEPPVIRASDRSGGDDSPDKIPDVLPILPLSDLVVFPYMVAPLLVASERSIRLIDEVVAGDRLLGLVLQTDPDLDQPRPDQLHDFGCVGRVLKMLRFPDDTIRVLVQGISRCKVVKVVEDPKTPFLKAKIKIVEEKKKAGITMEALLRSASNLFQEILSLTPSLPEELKIASINTQDPGRLADLIAANLDLSLDQKLEILRDPLDQSRLKAVTTHMARELKVLQLGSEIQEKVQTAFSKSQREYFLREQMKAIQEELGHGDERQVELLELRSQIEKAKMPDNAEKAAVTQLSRLAQIPPASAEYTVVRNYLDWLIAVPWSRWTGDVINLKKSIKILDEDHYGLTEVKDRILEFLAVLKLKLDEAKAKGQQQNVKAPILCFVGPPGVGKTSLGMSIARAMGKKFVRISLGGVRDEAEIRGHRRTYVGALPGRIIQALRQADSKNPVFMLDEIDKMGTDSRGDPASALLEVLDPQQNHNFSDHFLEVPFDLSQVMFICTANQLDPIPAPLRDRMEIIDIPGYTDQEKLQIALRYLIPRQLLAHGIQPDMVQFKEDAILRLIHGYTREAGVRGLERKIATACRRIARKTVEKGKRNVVISTRSLSRYLGQPPFKSERAERAANPGIAIGLAWTPFGGDVLFIEATQMPGGRHLTLTGSLGDVMRESAQAALSYVRANAAKLKVDPAFFEKSDIHVHVPAGAIPKDGPSAGVTIAIALISLLTGRRIDPELAMTGEISLQGKVLPVGGIKEKVLAASRFGLKKVLLPRLNETSVLEIPEDVRKLVEIVLISDVAQAVQHALLPSGARRKNPKVQD